MACNYKETISIFVLALAILSNQCYRLDLYNKSRMMGDYHVRFCERLGMKFPLPTRSQDRCSTF